MPDWFVPLLALLALLGFLYVAFVRTKPAPRSGNDPDRSTDVGGGPHSGD
jgi:hypothetical protein